MDFARIKVKTTHVAGNIYMLKGAGGNIGVSVGPDGILLVDDQFAPLAEKIRNALKELGEGPLKFLINTHFHGDHTGGNSIFGKEAHIIAHANVRKRLQIESSPQEALPVVTFDDSLSIHFNGEEIRVIHFPNSHTDGDSVIFFTGSNVVHMGDLFFSGRFPYVDLNSGGDVEGLIKHIEKLLAELPFDVKLIPGHGPLADIDDLKTYHQTLVATTDMIRDQIEAGKILDQIKEAGLPKKWRSWGAGFISTGQWIEIVHRSLTKKSEG
ncbi:MBL fold metallo-hydrolase [Candidatus Poribacteria bacterium]|nr:MBL fold metallo-hydrolase [Candidatus Poribacteria bacterium]